MTKKKKKKRYEDQVLEQGWLISYADMMTLVACFFILMMAFANYDPVGFSEKAKVVSQHFKQEKNAPPVDSDLQKIQQEIAMHPELKNFTKISLKDDALMVTFSGTVLFPDKKASLTPTMQRNVDELIKLIKVKDPNYRIIVEGHTDNQKIPSYSSLKSLWEISSLRAAKVASRFEVFGFDPKNIVALGMADSKPIAPNEDQNGMVLEDNLKINRRVVIKVLEPRIKSEEGMKMGLGVYFDGDNKP